MNFVSTNNKPSHGALCNLQEKEVARIIESTHQLVREMPAAEDHSDSALPELLQLLLPPRTYQGVRVFYLNSYSDVAACICCFVLGSRLDCKRLLELKS